MTGCWESIGGKEEAFIISVRQPYEAKPLGRHMVQ